MAGCFLATEISELCLGKPPLRSLPITATVADALSALKRSGEIHVSVWSCDHASRKTTKGLNHSSGCQCVGKISAADVICFLCKEENLSNPFGALQCPVSDLIPKFPQLVRHLESNSSLLEAVDCILDGAHNLVVPIQGYVKTNSRKKLLSKPFTACNSTLHNGREYCWLTQEDIVRFLLNSINVFSPVPTVAIESLELIDMNCSTVSFDDPASSALYSISQSLLEQSSVAVVDEDKRLIGEISPFMLASCEETVAAALSTLSAGDLMAYIDCAFAPEDLVQLVKERLEERSLTAMLNRMEESSLPRSSSSSSCSSEEEFWSGGRNGGLGRFSPVWRPESIICRPWNSLMAVMIQMISHRVNYAWVVDDDYTLAGMVTFAGILRVFRYMCGHPSCKPEGESVKKK